jgi:hypothetical protein
MYYIAVRVSGGGYMAVLSGQSYIRLRETYGNTTDTSPCHAESTPP